MTDILIMLKDTCQGRSLISFVGQLGVCNFPPDMLQEYLKICDKEGYVKPTVYQGRYNLISRELESIFPILREHGISFNAHR